MRRRLARFCKSLDFRLEELIETLGPQTGFQFLVIGPEPGVEVQGQDERGEADNLDLRRREQRSVSRPAATAKHRLLVARISLRSVPRSACIPKRPARGPASTCPVRRRLAPPFGNEVEKHGWRAGRCR